MSARIIVRLTLVASLLASAVAAGPIAASPRAAAVVTPKVTTVSGWSTTTLTRTVGVAWKPTVMVNGPAQRVVTLQRRAGKTWALVKSLKTNSSHRVTFSVPSTVKGTRIYRIVVPKSGSYAARVTASKIVKVVGAPGPGVLADSYVGTFSGTAKVLRTGAIVSWSAKIEFSFDPLATADGDPGVASFTGEILAPVTATVHECDQAPGKATVLPEDAFSTDGAVGFKAPTLLPGPSGYAYDLSVMLRPDSDVPVIRGTAACSTDVPPIVRSYNGVMYNCLETPNPSNPFGIGLKDSDFDGARSRSLRRLMGSYSVVSGNVDSAGDHRIQSSYKWDLTGVGVANVPR